MLTSVEECLGRSNDLSGLDLTGSSRLHDLGPDIDTSAGVFFMRSLPYLPVDDFTLITEVWPLMLVSIALHKALLGDELVLITLAILDMLGAVICINLSL